MRAHRLVPVAGDERQAAVVVRRARLRIDAVRVVGGAPREHDRPVVVVVLVREEERAGEAVVLRAVVAVVLVGGDRVAAEPAVLRHVRRQPVVMTEEDGLAVARLHELRRNRPVERPDRVRILHRQRRMEGQRHRRRRVDPGVERARHAGVVRAVGTGAPLRHFIRNRRRVIAERLMRPHRAGRPSLDGSRAAAEQRIDNHLCLVGIGGRQRVQRRRVLALEHVEARHRLRERRHAEQRARRKARGTDRGRGLVHERIQAADRRKEPCAGEEPPLDEIAPRDASPRELPDDLLAVAPRALRVAEPCLRRVRGQIKRISAHISLRRIRSVHATRLDHRPRLRGRVVGCVRAERTIRVGSGAHKIANPSSAVRNSQGARSECDEGVYQSATSPRRTA